MNLFLLSWLFFAPQLNETIEVRRTIIDAHVVDLNHELIPDLEAKDFRVLVDGKEAQIDSVSWIDDQAEVGEEPVELFPDGNKESTPPAPLEVPLTARPLRGRLFVLFVQTDFARQGKRVVGEMGVIASFHKFVETLRPQDQVALLSFDSHLKLRLDFSTDRAELQRIFPTVIAIDEPPAISAGAPPSLAALLDPHDMKYAPTSEKSLTVLARALRRIDGPKHLVLFGWGMSEPVFGRPFVNAETVRAGAELAAARTTVYAFNYGLGKQMAFGLKSVADDTGGFYFSAPVTEAFSPLELQFLPRLDAYLEGHYEIEFRSPVPVDPTKIHDLDVRVKRKGATVITKKSFVDIP